MLARVAETLYWTARDLERAENLARLLEAHRVVLEQAHEGAKAADESGDDGTNDLLVSDIIRSNEPQVWFIGEHLAATALQRAD